MTSQVAPLSLQINIEIDGKVHKIDYNEKESVQKVALNFIKSNDLQETLVDSLANSIKSFILLFKKSQFEKNFENESQLTKAESNKGKTSQSQFFKRQTCHSEESPDPIAAQKQSKTIKRGNSQIKKKKVNEKRNKRSKSETIGNFADSRKTIPKYRKSVERIPAQQATERATINRKVTNVNQRLYYDQVSAKVEKLRCLEEQRRLRQAAIEAEERSTFRPQINYTSELLNEVTLEEQASQFQNC